MERWAGRVALVTGASSGIGAAIAQKLVRDGMTVVGCGREVQKIEILSSELTENKAKGKLHGIQCDLTKEEQILSMFSKIKKDHGGVDVCINNAGLAHPGAVLTGKTEDLRNILDVNVIALSSCTRESVASMKERGVDDGHIININSINGHIVTVPASAYYSASKFAVTALTEGIRKELRENKSHIRVTAISPGAVKTDFANRMRGKEVGTKFYDTKPLLYAEDIADAVTYVLSAPPHVQVHDIIIRPVEQIH